MNIFIDKSFKSEEDFNVLLVHMAECAIKERIQFIKNNPTTNKDLAKFENDSEFSIIQGFAKVMGIFESNLLENQTKEEFEKIAEHVAKTRIKKAEQEINS